MLSKILLRISGPGMETNNEPRNSNTVRQKALSRGSTALERKDTINNRLGNHLSLKILPQNNYRCAGPCASCQEVGRGLCGQEEVEREHAYFGFTWTFSRRTSVHNARTVLVVLCKLIEFHTPGFTRRTVGRQIGSTNGCKFYIITVTGRGTFGQILG